MADPAAPGGACDPSLPEGAGLDRRMARGSALAALVVIFAGFGYSRESGFAIYALLFAIPYISFVLARGGRKWQARGWALAWVIVALALVPAVLTTLRITRSTHRSDVMVLIFLMALMLTLGAQLIFVRRAIPGKIAFGRPLLRTTLYYGCWLLVVGATLPNWYVPPIVRRENKAVDNLHKYSTAMNLYSMASKDASYPPKLAALAAPVEAGKVASSSMLDSELMCAQEWCVKDGYRFEYRPLFKEGRVVSYTLSARPLEFEGSGRQGFLLATDGRIYQTRQDRDALLTDGER